MTDDRIETKEREPRSLASARKEAPLEGVVGAGAWSAARYTKKTPLCWGVGPEMRSPAGLMARTIQARAYLVKGCPARVGGNP